jgi:hypothetical protein
MELLNFRVEIQTLNLQISSGKYKRQSFDLQSEILAVLSR